MWPTTIPVREQRLEAIFNSTVYPQSPSTLLSARIRSELALKDRLKGAQKSDSPRGGGGTRSLRTLGE